MVLEYTKYHKEQEVLEKKKWIVTYIKVTFQMREAKKQNAMAVCDSQ